MDGFVNLFEQTAKIVSYLGPTIAAFWALFVYRSNARRERARWAETLYSRFYVGLDFKKVRDLLACDPDDRRVDQFVGSDGSDWTDYLNFFEFVQYLQVSKQLSEEDVQALFGYYLECLKKHHAVVEYIGDRGKGFDYLRKRIVGE
jgi:hypothetical protein